MFVISLQVMRKNSESAGEIAIARASHEGSSDDTYFRPSWLLLILGWKGFAARANFLLRCRN
jgi:hypothetical protein